MIIATHNGKFHADDVFSIALLLQLYPDAQVIRTRDPQELASADIVLDVGGVYDPETKRFDHHQLSSGARPNKVLYSAIGLLWKEYGLEFCDGNEDIWRRIDKKLVMPLDAVDNGQDIHKQTEFRVDPLDISEVIGLFNPNNGEDFDKQFFVAVEVATSVLLRLKAKYQDAVQAEQTFLLKYLVAKDKRFLVLDESIPHAAVASIQPELLYTVYPGATGNWTIQAVTAANERFVSKKPLPERWRGKTGAELAAVTGVADAVFCHKAAFVAAAESKEGIMAMLEQALAS